MFSLSKYLLLQITTPEAIVRLKNSDLPDDDKQEVETVYFERQHHSSLETFLDHYMTNDGCSEMGLLMQVCSSKYFVLLIKFAQVY